MRQREQQGRSAPGPRVHRAWITHLLIGASLAAGWPMEAEARGGGKDRLLILRTEGTAVDDATRLALTRTLANRARQYKRLRVVVSNTDLVEEMFAFECTEAGVECLSKIGAKYKAARVIYSEVTRDGAGKLQWQMRVVLMKSASEPIARVAQSTTQRLDDPRRSRKAAQNGLLVLIGPVDLPQQRTALPGTLHVQLVGGGVALVYVDDKLAGRSSVSGLKVKLGPGTYRVRVVRAGFKDWNSSATVKSGRTTHVTVRLEDAPTPSVAAGPGGKVATTSIVRKWWFWTGVGVVALGAGVAIYALTRGDDGTTLGNAAFSIDTSDAHLDPIFGGG